MLKKIVNSAIEVKWKKAKDEGFYIGEDCWYSDEEGALCGFILHVDCAFSIERQLKYAGNPVEINNNGIKLDKFSEKIILLCEEIKSKCKLNVNKHFRISERQYIYKDNAIFDYRKFDFDYDFRKSAIDFESQNVKVYLFCDGAYVIFNKENQLLFIILKDLKKYQFCLESCTIFLSEYLHFQEIIFDFIVDTWTDRFCNIFQYKQLVDKTNNTLQQFNLPDFIKDRMKISIQYWKEQSEDEDNRDADIVWEIYKN